MMRARAWVLGLVFTAWCAGVLAQSPTAAPPSVLRVITFNGGWDLPFWAAQRQGFFEAQGVSVQIAYTPSSEVLVRGLYDGKYDLAFATFDNFVAYQEGQGEVKLGGDPDFVAFMGGDGGFLSVVAGPQVKSFAELKGRTLSVDAMTNGLAFVLRELVARGGLAESDVTYVRAGGTPNRYRELVAGKHDATLLRTPFELLAKSRGLNVLATAESLGAYQGTVGAVRKSWAQAHEAAMVGFLRAYRAGVEWVCDPANREIAEALLVANIRDMTPSLARQSYDLLVAKDVGLYRDLRLSPAGMQTVLALRTRYGEPRKTLGDASKYVDTTWYTKAFGAQ
jgi:ABC-type nitrate/sulfonate/bicarbonate transport system substrate-binding protein